MNTPLIPKITLANAHKTQERERESNAGFTLLELLIVIGILAVLAAVVVTVLNPTDYFRRARDSRRMSDISIINRALGYYEYDKGTTGMGTSSVVYVSLPDTSPTCASYSLPTLPTGWSYNCVPEANLRKIDSTGWIPINFASMGIGSPFSAIPIDPVNSADGFRYYTYITGSSWKLTAVFESSHEPILKSAQNDGGNSDSTREVGTNLNLGAGIFPAGWERTPNINTWVMKYEAKYDKDGDSIGDTASSANCPADAGLGLDWRDVGCNTAAKVVSTANGAPIVHITHDQAKAACTALNARLINNQEWMQIARNVEQVAENWSGGTVGTGCLFRGNVGVDDACGYNGSDPEYGASRNSKAILALSSGAKIYDLSGNVWEHVMKDANDTLVNNTPTDGGVAGWRWIEHTAITGYGDLSYGEIRPSDNGWNAAQGMGRVYTYNGAFASRVLLRGGDWSYSSDAGAFSLILDWGTAVQSISVGFRCTR